MNTKISHFFKHLMRRRVLIWMVTLLLILGFAGAGGAILWSVRMNVTYRVEIKPPKREGWDGSITAIIPASDFQLIRRGDEVTIVPEGKKERRGVIRSVITEPERIKLKITGHGLPSEKFEADITLRAERLLAAFIH
ncbi:MAG: hypothetical protein U9N73_01995 [Candidatus Auribacterota bacterium]|nr:hypothetical protein [Candidatus Auribacterota bacterium]